MGWFRGGMIGRQAARRRGRGWGCAESLEVRALLSSVPAAVGLGTLDHTRNARGKVGAGESDTFQFTVQADQSVAFDLDPRGKGAFPGTVQVFDDQGQLVGENSGGTGPRETDASGYLELTFASGGKYTVAVSAGSSGKYALQVTPLTQITSGLSGNTIQGEIALPNRQQHAKQTGVFLQRVDENGNPEGAIEQNVRTWIVIHGRIDSAESFRSLAGSIVRGTGDQVLLLDWSGGAKDNTKQSSLNGAEWIPEVGAWVKSVLGELQISGEQTILTGHSWGSYVAYDIAQKMGGVKSLVALDPAYAGVYPYQQIDFGAVSDLSWAIYAEDLFGSAPLSGTADEAFGLEYLGTDPAETARHGIPVAAFQSLMEQSHDVVPFLQGLLSPNRLISGTASDEWKLNQYSLGSGIGTSLQVFEGLLQVEVEQGGWQVTGLRYIQAGSGVEVTI